MNKTLVQSLAGVAVMVGLAALGVGVGTGWTLLIVAAYAIIFLAGLVPAAVSRHESEPRRAAARPDAPPAAAGWRAPEAETSGKRVWIEPERQRLH